jgi:hypothetical protein
MNREARRKQAASLKAHRRAERKHAAQTVVQYPVDLASDRLAVAVARVAAKLRADGETLNVFYPAAAELVIAECMRIAPSSPTADEFFDRPKPGAPVHWQYISRVLAVADTLYALRGSVGFDVFCKRLRCQPVRASFFEAFAARMFTDLGYAITIRPETGVKGQDFDFVASKNGTTINCEVTTLTGAAHSATTVGNALEQKRKQLPTDAPAIIFVIVPEAWFVGRNDEVVQLLRDDALQAYNRSQRINSIVFLNEQHNDFGLPDRGNLGFVFDASLNLAARHQVPDLAAFIDGTLHRPDVFPNEQQLAALANVHQDSPFFHWAAEFWNANDRAKG